MSCLFDSLSKSVNMNSNDLRKVICQYLATNPNILDDISTEQVLNITENSSLSQYIERMSNTMTWGGAIEIKAFCNLFRKRVLILVLYTRKMFEMLPNGPPENTIVVAYTGNHFELVAITSS